MTAFRFALVAMLVALISGDHSALSAQPAATPLPRRFPRATPAAIQEQTRALASTDAIERAMAACVLARMGRRAASATSALVNLLGDATSINPISCQNMSDFDESWSQAGVGPRPWGMTSYSGTKTTPGREAARALASIGREAVGPLLRAVRSNTAAVRANAVRALGGIRDARMTDTILPLAKDADPLVRAEVAGALGRRRGGAQALVALAKDSDGGVRMRAITSLGQLRDGDTLTVVAAAAGDRELLIRARAAMALGRFRDIRALEPLTRLSTDAAPEVRERAVSGLGQLRDPQAFDAIAARLRDDDPEVREHAAGALGQLRSPKGLDPLIRALQDEESTVRERAAAALGQLRDPRAADALIAALKDSDPDVREHAVRALGQTRQR